MKIIDSDRDRDGHCSARHINSVVAFVLSVVPMAQAVLPVG